MRDSKTSCKTRKWLLAIKGHAGYIIDTISISIPVVVNTGIRIWEIESLYLEKLWETSNNPRVIGLQYILKSNYNHYLVLQWIGMKDNV